MLRKLSRRLTYANVMSTFAAVGVLAGGTAYAANTIASTDIIDGQVKSVDVGDAEIKSADVKDESLTTFDVSTFLGADVVDSSLTGADIRNGSLTATDIRKPGGLPTSFGVTIGTVSARSCKYFNLSGYDGLSDRQDTLLLTPSYEDSATNLVYTAEAGARYPHIKICNPTDSAIDDGATSFSFLAIDG